MDDFEVKLKILAVGNTLDGQRHIFFYFFAVKDITNNCSKSLDDPALQLPRNGWFRCDEIPIKNQSKLVPLLAVSFDEVGILTDRSDGVVFGEGDQKLIERQIWNDFPEKPFDSSFVEESWELGQRRVEAFDLEFVLVFVETE